MSEDKKTGKSFWDVVFEFPKIAGALTILAVLVFVFLLWRKEVKKIGPVEFFPPTTQESISTLPEKPEKPESQDNKAIIEKVQTEFNNLLLLEKYQINNVLILPNTEIKKFSKNGSTSVSYQIDIFIDLIKINKQKIKAINIIDVGLLGNNKINSISLQQIDNE